jgi:hypothetical protein
MSGDRGEVGTGTAGRNLKRRFRAANTGESLKAFAKRRKREKDSNATEWLLNKSSKGDAQARNERAMRVSKVKAEMKSKANASKSGGGKKK